MLPESVQDSLLSEIDLFIEYGVAEQEREVGRKLVARYRNDAVGLAVLKEFYMVLPEVREEAVSSLLELESVQGVTLLVMVTANHSYLAVVSESEVHIIGEYGKEKLPKELLTYFGYGSDEEFRKTCKPVTELAEYGAEQEEGLCSACQVAPGELHLFGCPVEICPWCDGQLSRCNCRFEQLELEEIENEEQLEEFFDRLEGKGRIPYAADQNPAYPGTSAGLDGAKKGS